MTPPAERASTPAHLDVSPAAPEVTQPVAMATAVEATQVTRAATAEAGTSAVRPTPSVEHVSVLRRVRVRNLLCVAYDVFVCLQPFYLNLVESVKAFVQVEQDSVRASLEQITRKFDCPFVVEILLH